MDYIKEIRSLVGHRPLLLCGSGAYIVKDGSVLLQRRKDNGLLSNHGGLMEPGESTEETMRREVLEETGLTVTKAALLCVTSGQEVHHIYENGDECYFVDTVYLVTDFEGEMHPQESEVSELIWYPIDALPPESDLNPADRPSFRALKAHLRVG